MQLLRFAEPFLQANLLERAEKLPMQEPTILLNIGPGDAQIGGEILIQRESGIFAKTTIVHAEAMVSVSMTVRFSATDQLFFERATIMQTWTHVYDIFQLPHLKHTNLWRSTKEQIGSIGLNLWFAAEGTDCGMHNEHDFLEVHTQIWGTGHMQKFAKKDPVTLYQDIFMTPGFTHAPFCTEDEFVYPWHRYFADTDCLWLAVEYN